MPHDQQFEIRKSVIKSGEEKENAVMIEICYNDELEKYCDFSLYIDNDGIADVDIERLYDLKEVIDGTIEHINKFNN